MARTLAVVIGRFNPVHSIHLALIKRAVDRYDEVLVLLGSAFKAPDWKDPFSWDERWRLIVKAASEARVDVSRVRFKPLKDYPYSNNRWVFQVQKTVDETIEKINDLEPLRVVVVGSCKDDTSFYLKLFPQWGADVEPVQDKFRRFSATELRAAMFEERWEDAKELTMDSVVDSLRAWLSSEKGRAIQAEYRAAKETKLVLAYEKSDGTLVKAPFEPTFHAVDSCVLWRGHVLLIRRRATPGKGLWALPGGFLDPKEWIRDGAVRERQEESRIKFRSKGSRKRLHLDADWCKSQHTFDYPGRSLRGRTITTGFLWVIPDEFEVDVEAADDADRARWFPIYEVLNNLGEQLFEDHQSIIAHFVLGANQ